MTEPLFYADIRLQLKTATKHKLAERRISILAALSGFSEPGYQKLTVTTNALVTLSTRIKNHCDNFKLYKLTHRLPSILTVNSLVLSSGEIASLYHLPDSKISRAENTVTALSRTLPLPAPVKQAVDNKKCDVYVGVNSHRGEDTPIGLTEDERAKHIYVVGGTGSGKTTMLEYMAIQDILSGHGLAVIDPHGDLVRSLIGHIPSSRLKDVVYFDPADLAHPIGLNLLELPKTLKGDQLEHQQELVCEAVVSIFRKIFSQDDSGGHRVEYILRSAILTALTIKGATLFTVLKLIQDPYYRARYVNKLDDEALIDFWKNEFGPAGGMQRVKMSAGVTAKLGRFWHSASARRVFSQTHSTLDFSDIMDSGKILLCNFSKGSLGEDVSELFGTAVLAKLQLAALKRSVIPVDKRRAFYLYIDEFQNYATDTFVQMLSESRKYNLRLSIAEQSTSQQQDRQWVQVILANVGTVICFRGGNIKDEELLLPLFGNSISPGEIANLPSYCFYAKFSALYEPIPAFSGRTILADKSKHMTAAAVIKYSQDNYGGKYIKPNYNERKKPGSIRVPKFSYVMRKT